MGILGGGGGERWCWEPIFLPAGGAPGDPPPVCLARLRYLETLESLSLFNWKKISLIKNQMFKIRIQLPTRTCHLMLYHLTSSHATVPLKGSRESRLALGAGRGDVQENTLQFWSALKTDVNVNKKKLSEKTFFMYITKDTQEKSMNHVLVGCSNRSGFALAKFWS